MKATVSSKGQVTIPKALRDALGLSEGTVLDFREEAGRLVAQKADPRDRVAEVYGILGDGRTSDDVLADLRGYEPDPAA
jgi:AbrB family looped-hinge helix DNA binding protein